MDFETETQAIERINEDYQTFLESVDRLEEEMHAYWDENMDILNDDNPSMVNIARSHEEELERFVLEIHKNHIDYIEKLDEETTKYEDLEYEEAVERLYIIQEEEDYNLRLLERDWFYEDPTSDLDDDEELDFSNDELATNEL